MVNSITLKEDEESFRKEMMNYDPYELIHFVFKTKCLKMNNQTINRSFTIASLNFKILDVIYTNYYYFKNIYYLQ